MSTTLSDFGSSLTLPDGWYGEIFRVAEGSTTRGRWSTSPTRR